MSDDPTKPVAEPPQPEAVGTPRFLPLADTTHLGRLTNEGIDKATKALRPVLFGSKEPPYPWRVKSIMIEIDKGDVRHEIVYVGERWAHMQEEKKAASKELVAAVKKKYQEMTEEERAGADEMMFSVSGATFAEILKITPDPEEEP